MSAPLVGIVVGSASDLSVAEKAVKELKNLEIPCEVAVASAHRTPEEVRRYAERARGRGLRVLIGLAGLSAALPGVLAAHTDLPVLGVPVAAGTLGGLDALLSVSQMPPGVPVGAFGVEGARNAALFAARVLALSDPLLTGRLEGHRARAARDVAASRSGIAPLPEAPEEAYAP